MTTTVTLGGGGRRWWPFLVGAVVLWVLVAVLVGGGDGDEDDEASAPTSSSTSTTTRGRSSTTVTTNIAGAPLLGRATGWQLVLAAGEHDDRIVDLDTGAVTQTLLGAILASRPDGVLSFDASTARILWRPEPLLDGTVVDLGPGGFFGSFPLVRERAAWLIDVDGGSSTDWTARLVGLDTGDERAAVVLPPDVALHGLARDGLVVSAGGDVFRIDAAGAAGLVGHGTFVAIVGDRIVLRECDASLRCHGVAHDALTGADLGPADALPALGPTHPDGATYLAAPASVGLVIDGEGRSRQLPGIIQPDDLYSSAWSPDGRLLLVGAGTQVLIVDPFDPDGPALVGRFEVGNVTGAVLAVVGPRSEG